MSTKMSALGLCAALFLTLTLAVRPAMAMHQAELEEIKSIAHALQDSAEIVQDTAEDQAHHFTASEQNLLAAVNRFASSARRFHRTIESYFASPAAVRGTLARMNADAAVVSASIRRAHAMESVYDDWDRCRRLLRRINFKMDAEPDESIHTHAQYGSDRVFMLNGTSYPRRGELYLRDGRWIPIQDRRNATVTRVLRSLLTDENDQ